MHTKYKLFFAKITVLLGVAPLLLQAHEYGPDPGRTNAPGDNPATCIGTGCHSGKVNTGPGNVKILLPAGNTGTYTPGQSMQLLIQITDSTKTAYGFELTARTGAGNSGQAGHFVNADKNTFVQCLDNSVIENPDPANGKVISGGKCPAQIPYEYIEHGIFGYLASINRSGSFTYAINWTPPASSTGGNVTFYIAANAGPGEPAVPSPTNVYTATQVLTPLAAPGPPSISNVLDAESSRATVVPGEWVAIYGSNFGSTTRTWAAGDFNNGNNLPTNLSGVTVTFGGLPAAIFFISPGQIDVQVPAGVSGTVPVVVTSGGTASAAFNTNVVANAPSLFYYASGTNVFPAATHLDGTLIGDPAVTPGSKKAVVGETIVLYVNGIASSPSGVIIGAPISYSSPVTVTFGSKSVSPPFVGLVAAGEYQVNLAVPAGLTSGNTSITIATQGQTSPSNIVIPIQ